MWFPTLCDFIMDAWVQVRWERLKKDCHFFGTYKAFLLQSEDLVLIIVEPNRYQEQSNGLRVSILLDCSKTLIAKAMASHRIPILLAQKNQNCPQYLV